MLRLLNKKIIKIISIILAIAVLAMAGFLFLNKPKITEAGWWNDSWNYRKAITINHTQVTGDLTDFPMLVSLTDANLGSHAQASGNDILFIDSEGKKLSHEIEKFATSTGELVAWVKIPSLSSTQDETIYMYYGNRSVSSQQDADNVWDDNYVGVWHFLNNENASTTDSTQYNIVGQTHGNASTTLSGKIGSAFQFDGDGDYIDCGDPTSLEIDGQITVSVWINFASTSYPNLQAIAGKKVFGSGEKEWGASLVYSDFNSKFGNGSVDATVNTGSSTKDTWYHYVVTREENGDIKNYLNGAKIGSTNNISGQINPDYNFYISRSGAGDLYFVNGIIDEVKVSNIGRTADWIQTEYNNQNSPATFLSPQAEEVGPGPVGYWSFDEGYGATAHDETANKNDGTITGATWQDESMCISGKCLYFDGNSDYIAIDNAIIGDNNTWTMSAWAKKASSSPGSNALVVYSETNSGTNLDDVMLIGWDSDIVGDIRNSSTWSYAHSNIDENNKWYYITFVQNSDTSRNIYVDGVFYATDTTDAEVMNTDRVTIGARRKTSSVGGYFQGFIDEVKIYPYARTADQVRQDYAAGLAGVKSSHGVAASFGSKSDSWMTDGLVGYWKMDESATTSGAIDSSGNGNDGTYYGDASTTAGKFGNSGIFATSSHDYVSIGSGLSGNYDSFSIATWVKFTNSGNHMGIVDGMADGYLIFYQNLQIWFRWQNASNDWADCGSVRTAPKNQDEWYYVVATHDGYRGSVYVNGELEAYKEDSGGLDFTGVVDIGIRSLSMSLEGQIDEMRIYNRALSPDEVRKLYEWAPGPVGYWKMDEKSGTDVYDSSGNGLNGSFVDTPLWQTGKYGSSLYFDGSNDRVSISHNAILEPASITVGFWAKLQSDATRHVLVTKWNGFTTEVNADGTFKWGLKSLSGQYFGNNQINWDEWVYLSGTFDDLSKEQCIYINGIQTECQNPAGSISYNQSGLYFSWNAEAHGLIDDVRIYNYARTQKQILEDMHAGKPGPWPVLDLKFDEGYGATAHDSSIYGNDGLLQPGTGGTNTASSAMWSLDGKNGKAMEFDGTDDYVSIPDSDILSGGAGKSISISTWVKLDQLVSYQGLVTKNYNSSYKDWSLSGSDTGFIFYYENGSNNDGSCSFNPGIETNRWYHVVATFDGSSRKCKIYLDGKQGSESTNDYDLYDSTASVEIGRGGYLGHLLDGEIDDVKIYNYVLSEDEVKTLYNQGASAVMGAGSTATTSVAGVYTPSNAASREYCVPGSSDYCAPPVGEWDFDEKAGNTAYDKSGNGNDGTLTNGPTWTRGKIGSALDFDGSSEYIRGSHSNSLSSIVNNFTVSAWIKPGVLSGTQRVFSIERAISSSDGFGFGLSNSGLLLTTYDVKDYTSTAITLSTDTWQYVSAVMDTNHNVDFYVNGIFQETITHTVPGVVDANDDFTIGSQGGNEKFNGKIDNLLVYNYARTPAQIAYEFNRGKPIAEWQFDECKGGTIHDNAKAWNGGTANNGVLHLGTTGVTATGTCASSSNSFWYNGKDGKINHAGSFDGTDDYVDLGSNSDINFGSSDFTAMAWFRTATTGSGIILSNGEEFTGGKRYEIKLDSIDCGTGKVKVEIDDNTTKKYICSTVVLNDNNWHIAAMARDGNNLRFYIDGVEDGNSPTDITGYGNIDSSRGAQIGITYSADSSSYISPFPGIIDDVKIWNYALTAEQVKMEYAGGAVRFGN